MGVISKGILGGFSGTVGTVIGSSWKGIDYMRSQPARRTNNPSPKQLAQQARFGMTVKFLQCMNDLLMVTFHNFADRMTGFNSAMSYNLKNAVAGNYPDYFINYPQVLVSRGDLPNAGGLAAAAGANKDIAFSWTDNSGMGKAAATDKSILVAYCAYYNMCIYTLNGPARNAGAALLDTSVFSGYAVETYIAFINEEGTEVATSFYVGQVMVG